MGCDVSDEALNIARMNADALQAAIDFVPLDFLSKEQRKQLPQGRCHCKQSTLCTTKR
jgi:methylase of polypeptide subunit release factors